VTGADAEGVVEAGEGSSVSGPWTTAERDYPVRLISRSTGLPSAQVHALTIDHRGILWLAGPSGLSKYDGTRVRTFTQRQGFTTHGLRTVAAAPDNAIWIGTDVGVDVFRDGTVDAMPDGWCWGLANSIVVEDSGKVWIGSALGLISWKSGQGFEAESDTRLTDDMIATIAIDSEGNVWAVSRRHGLLCRTGGAWHAVTGEVSALGAILTLAAGLNGTMFVGGEHGALHIDAIGTIQRRIDTPPGSVTAARLIDHELWLGVDTELRHHLVVDDVWTFEQAVVSGSRVNAIQADMSHNVWACTDSIGLVKVEVVRRAMSRPGLGLGAVFSIRPTRSGAHLVAGDRGAALVRFGKNSHTSTTLSMLPNLARAHAWDLIEDTVGDYWAATPAGLEQHRLDGTVRRIGGDHPVLGAPGRVLLERDNGLWVGTLNGLCIVRGDIIETRLSVGPNGGEPMGYVYSLVPDGDTVWIGTLGKGLWRDQGVGPERCLGEGLTTTGNSYAMAVHHNGTVAVSQDNRIVLIDPDGTSRILTEVDDALAGWALDWGDDNTLWVGSSTGLCQYSTQSGELLHQVTIWMGRTGWEFTTSRAMFRDAVGRMLCGLDSGLAVVDLRQVHDLTQRTPDVVLSSLTWSNTTPATSHDRTIVTQGKWSLEAAVYSTWHIFEAERVFRFRLLGFEAAWSEASDKADIRYSSLPAGTYTLQAQAYSPLAGWGEIAPLLTLQVRPAKWRSRWEQWRSRARRRSVSRLRQQSHVLEQRVRERTVELSNATNRLTLAQARERQFSSDVSHQLRTPLTRLRLRVETVMRGAERAELEAVMADLDHLDQTVHYLLQHARDVRPEIEHISLVQAAQRAANRWLGQAVEAGRSLVIDIAEDCVVLGSRVGVDQILDVLVDNALGHGAGVVTISVRGLLGGGAIDVADENSVLQPEDAARIFRRGEGSGNGIGLAIARELAEADGGKLVLRSRTPTTFSLVLLESTDNASETS
jgi:signal transduction histidine kinase/ligand-binding sensor domain-containing protein